jgi:hypothetical protein
VRQVRPCPDMRQDAAAIMAKVNANVTVTPTGCWEWQRFRNFLGYGATSWRGRPWKVTRLVYTATHGAFDPLLYVCHRCDNPPCCNPDHLFLGDHTTNQRDMVAKGRHSQQKRFCHRGHEFTPENTRLHTDCHGDTHRRCIACEKMRVWVSTERSRERSREYRRRRKLRNESPSGSARSES